MDTGRWKGMTGNQEIDSIKAFGHEYPIAFSHEGQDFTGAVWFDDEADYDSGQFGGEFVHWAMEVNGADQPNLGVMSLVAADALPGLRSSGYAESRYAKGFGWSACPYYARAAEESVRQVADEAGILVRTVRETGDTGVRKLNFA